MGIHNSKDHSNLTLSTVNNNNNPTWRPSIKNKFSIKKKTMNYNGWQEISRCSHSDWLNGVAESFGFPRHKFICTSELHSVCAPGFCSESLSHKLYHGAYRSSSKNFQSTKIKKLREHFEYNHIPAMISSLQNYSVHGLINGCSMSGLDHSDTIMLLIYSVVLEKTKFIIVDLKLNRYVCALGDDYNGLVDAKKVHAAWSMDKTQVIIRVPMVGGRAALDFYKIVRKEAKLYRRIVPIDVKALFQFCPNYWSSCLILYTYSTETETTLINYNTTALTPGGSNKVQIQAIQLRQQLAGSYLYLMNVHSWSVCKNQSIQIDNGFQLLSILYTRDSVYTILTFADNHCHCGQTLPISYFDVYQSNSLQRLHRIYTQHISHVCPWHMCRNYLTPIFSVSSSRMAFCTTKNNDGRELQVSIVVLPNELNLKSICRRLINHYLNQVNGKIEDITRELPYRLNQYIQYRPECQ
ncbi:unnamed protein product [Rotaria socialis]|uniref:SOCS box domain-containing protein n=1 Tax=Rotaria socialis TaxID=392032 RepID=A0A818ZRN2_9BILA|nr:unnamed protein product [Rotaria socialis]CAF3316563.1 unnamed protein product [Rotaria socialis]CAF3773570.1 unnamed protein product [Rotaria socialis]CAF4270811.1 unnamed protein product [Rotaria socialis]CAF4276928.1 unnamed protein product [Rotaria socialis]